MYSHHHGLPGLHRLANVTLMIQHSRPEAFVIVMRYSPPVSETSFSCKVCRFPTFPGEENFPSTKTCGTSQKNSIYVVNFNKTKTWDVLLYWHLKVFCSQQAQIQPWHPQKNKENWPLLCPNSHTLPKTNNLYLKIGHPKRKPNRIPTIHFNFCWKYKSLK